ESEREKVKDSLQRVADENGYDLRSSFGGHGLQLYLSTKNSLHIDFFFWVEDYGIMRRNHYVPGTDTNKGLDFPKEWVDELIDIEMDGRLVKAPKDPANMCEWRYGESWRVPMRIFKFNNTPNKNAGMKY